MMELLLRGVNAIVAGYTLLVIVLILHDWYSHPTGNRPVQLLRKIASPYLKLFRRIPFLQVGGVVLAPMVALLCLATVQIVLSGILRYGVISLGIVLVSVFNGIWFAVAMILSLLIASSAVRLILHTVGGTPLSRFTEVFVGIVDPVTGWLGKMLSRRFDPSDGMVSGLTLIFLLVIFMVGWGVVHLVTGLIPTVPV